MRFRQVSRVYSCWRQLIVGMAVLCAAGIGEAQQRQADPPVFRATTHLVPVYVTVTDATGRMIPDLTRDAFTILDNGVPQEITTFSNTPIPFSAAVMLDTSLSMSLILDKVKQGAEQFLIRLEPTDQAMLGSLNDKIQFVCDLTNDRDALVGSLRETGFGQSSRIYDAVAASVDELERADNRKVVVVFTDGGDMGSRISLNTAITHASTHDVMVYAVGMPTELRVDGQTIRTTPDSRLRRLSEETGGGFFVLKDSDELGPTFTRVAQELRSQYLLGFTPRALDGKPHKIDVRLSQPGLKARARRSYVASAKP